MQCGDHIGPGALAFLTHDLQCSGHNPALTIEGPATLILSRHTLDCQDPGAVGIQVNGAAAIVLKGTVTGCDIGIGVSGQGSYVIKEVTATLNRIGFALQGGSNGNTLNYNKAQSNLVVGFIFLGFSHDNELSRNLSQGHQDGVGVSGDRNTVKYNTAKDYSGVGFDLEGQDLMVIDNRAIGDAGFSSGFDILGRSHTWSQNVAKNNLRGFCFFSGGSAHKVLKNTAMHNALGIEFLATESILLGNTALDNSDTDLIDGNTNCDNNLWVSNRFQTSNLGCIH